MSLIDKATNELGPSASELTGLNVQQKMDLCLAALGSSAAFALAFELLTSALYNAPKAARR